jgi:membrane protease YdiL (CAAX protease family)
MFALIMAYIWELRYTYTASWIAIPTLMLASHVIRGEYAHGLGFRVGGIGKCCREFGPAVAALALGLVTVGVLFDAVRPITPGYAFLSWAMYLLWGLVQQYVMNGYFLNRLEEAVSPRAAPILAAALFSAAHSPNWFLMAVGLAAGYGCALIYRRHQNLYFLGAAHGTIGYLLFLVSPDSISHHFRVGPGWFR